MSNEPAVALDPSDVSVAQYQVYRDTRTGHDYKVVYHDDEDDFIVMKCQDADAVSDGSLHYTGPKSQFVRQASAGRWTLVENPHA